MANRNPAACSSAIREAWANERELVLEGRGTRDWTPDQQADIVDGVTPTDENGQAFEGHHMRSAEAYPEDQGNPDNIQFLTRSEHQAAHGGSFQNETSAYYDPETGKSYSFNEVVSAPEIELSNPTETYDEEEDWEEAPNETEGENQSADLSEGAEESMGI